MKARWGITALLVAALACTAHAQRNRLNEGDPAPNINVTEWLHGEGATELERGTIYLVEFWATWCIPCRQAIPKLSRLQRRHADDGVVILGIAMDEKQETVRNYILSNPGLFSYPVGWDKGGSMARSWMSAAGLQGIPALFMVDREGRVQYIGHSPDDQLERILRLVIQGRYDAKLFKEVRPAIESYENARRVRNWRLASTHIEQIISHDSHIFADFNLDHFEMKLVDMNDPKRAYDYANELIQKYANDSALLVSLARFITLEPKIDNENRDLSVAMKAAQAARRASAGDDPSVLAALALVHFHQNNVQEAISLQRRAWMIAPASRKPGYERTLRDYQQAHQRAARMSAGRD